MIDPRKELEGLFDRFVPKLRSAFQIAISDVVDNAVLKDLIAAVKANQINTVFKLLGFSEAAMRPLTAAIEETFETGGIFVGRTFPKILNTSDGRMIFRFNVKNERAESWLRNNSSALVGRLEDEARTNVRNTLQAGMSDGRNPRKVALDIVGRMNRQTGHREGGIIGLSKNQESWVRSARTKLTTLDKNYFDLQLRDKRFDSTVAKAIESGKPLSGEVVDKLMDRYKANALKKRALDIAQTETIQSLNRADYEATKQAVDSGAVRNGAVTREWDTTGLDNVRNSHRGMDGQKVGLDEAFTTPRGDRLMFPGDRSLNAPAREIVNCHCRVKTVVDWFDGVE